MVQFDGPASALTENWLEPPITWFHSFDIGDNRLINGVKSLAQLRVEASLIFTGTLAGRSVLDIGAWDGYFSFEAERLGASSVLATDHFCWSGKGWGSKAGFDYIHKRLGSNVKSLDVDVKELHKRGLGQFDIVLFLGVFYHLKDPYIGIEAAAGMCRDHLVIETVTTFENEQLPVMRLLEPRALDTDPTNFWVPNIPALKLMLTNVGFGRIQTMHPADAMPRGRARGWLRRRRNEAFRRTIVHAWRS